MYMRGAKKMSGWRMIVTFPVVLCLLLTAGCATTVEDLIRDQRAGVSHVYQVNEEQAWKIAKKVFLMEGIQDWEIEEDRGEHLINYIGVLGVWIFPVDEESTRIIAKKAATPCSPLPDLMDEETFHERFGQAAEIIKAGKTLP
jgi:hypothetical protein